MRLRLLFLAPAFVVAACGGGGDGAGENAPAIDDVTPDFGPLGGGKRVVISGSGFLNAGAPPNRVVIGGREASQAGVIDDETLEVIIPEADSPGAVDVVVFNSNGLAMAAGAFRYSDPPAIDGVSPATLRFDQGGTITVTGSGFADEDAAVTTVFIDGVAALDVDVVDDGRLTFTALPGTPGGRPDIQVVNGRGDTNEDDAYRYVAGAQGGLLLIPNNIENVWAYFYDIALDEAVVIPRIDRGGGGGPGYRSVVRAGGQMYGQFRDDTWQNIDFDNQIATAGGGGGDRLQSMAAIGNTVYAYNRNSGSFGTVNVANGSFTQIVGSLPCCQGAAIAPNAAGTMFLVTNGNAIRTINVSTGALGAAVTLAGGFRHITGMRFVGSTLYAGTRDGEVVTINPTTGAVTNVISVGIAISEIEVFE